MDEGLLMLQQISASTRNQWLLVHLFHTTVHLISVQLWLKHHSRPSLSYIRQLIIQNVMIYSFNNKKLSVRSYTQFCVHFVV